MLGFIIIIGLFMLVAIFPFVRYCITHPILTGKQAVYDVLKFIKHKEKNLCPFYGQIYMFVASGARAFGSGKTLSMVEWLRFVYKKYNGLPVWDEDKGEFVNQRVIIISNVQLNDVPYIPFRGRDQFVNIDKLEHGSMDIVIFAIDEAGQEFNSREYKTNLPTQFLTKLLTIRHHKIAICMTSQRFNFVDKLLRNCTGIVTTCKKRWRIVRLQEYDAFAIENSNNPELIQPLKTRYYFADDALYHSYDNMYDVVKLKEQLEHGDLLDTSEILERISSDGDVRNVQNRLRKRYRKE